MMFFQAQGRRNLSAVGPRFQSRFGPSTTWPPGPGTPVETAVVRPRGSGLLESQGFVGGSNKMTIELHTWNTPNGRKISVALEEMGLAYKVIPVNISQGEQMAPEVLAISPNNKIPGIVDPDCPRR